MIASIVFILLYMIVLYLLLSNSDQNNSSNLLANSPRVIYGQVVGNQDKFSFKMDEIGEAAILFNTPKFNAADYTQLEISINGLSSNYQILLVWTNTLTTKPFEQQLMQANNGVQVDLLSINPDWRGGITQVGLRIMPQTHLGIAVPSNQITIDSVVLSNGGFFSNFTLLADYWLKYEAWSYRSINHLKMNSLLPIYAQPLIFILMWLSVCVVIFLFVFRKTKINLWMLIVSAWLFLDMLFLHNYSAKNNWVNAIYVADEKPLPDEELNKLALQIKSLLGLNNDRIAKIKKHKVLVLSPDRYQRARLIYHMLPVNSSFLDKNSEANGKAKVKPGDFILSYHSANNPQKPISGQLQINDLNINVKEIAHGNKFSIMRVLN